MTAKGYLSQAWSIKLRIESMTEMLEFLRSAAEYIPSQLSDMPHSATRNIHKNEDAIIRYVDFEKRIQAERDKLSDVMAAIENINDPAAQAVIVKRYIERKTWDNIAVETYVSLRQVHRLHQSVLDDLENRIKDGTDLHTLA